MNEQMIENSYQDLWADIAKHEKEINDLREQINEIELNLDKDKTMNEDYEEEILDTYKDIFKKVYENSHRVSDALDEFNMIDFSTQEQHIFDMVMEGNEAFMNRLRTLHDMLVTSRMKHKPLAEGEFP